MIPNPIRKVLSSIRRHRVYALLMGGQACVLYGVAEFSRDIDLAILADPRNLACLQKALADLKAEPIGVPPFDASYLQRGHAVHFRCMAPGAERMRLDVMSKMRGLDPAAGEKENAIGSASSAFARRPSPNKSAFVSAFISVSQRFKIRNCQTLWVSRQSRGFTNVM